MRTSRGQSGQTPTVGEAGRPLRGFLCDLLREDGRVASGASAGAAFHVSNFHVSTRVRGWFKREANKTPSPFAGVQDRFPFALSVDGSVPAWLHEVCEPTNCYNNVGRTKSQ